MLPRTLRPKRISDGAGLGAPRACVLRERVSVSPETSWEGQRWNVYARAWGPQIAWLWGLRGGAREGGIRPRAEAGSELLSSLLPSENPLLRRFASKCGRRTPASVPGHVSKSLDTQTSKSGPQGRPGVCVGDPPPGDSGARHSLEMTGLSPSGHTALEHGHSGTPQERGGDMVSWVQISTITNTPRPCTLQLPTPDEMSSQTLLVLRGGLLWLREAVTCQRSLTQRVGLGWGLEASSLRPISRHPTGQGDQRGPRHRGWEGGKLEPAEKCVWAPAGTTPGCMASGTPSRSDPQRGRDNTSDSPGLFS